MRIEPDLVVQLRLHLHRPAEDGEAQRHGVRVLWTRRGFDIDGDRAGTGVGDDLGNDGLGSYIIGAANKPDIEGRQEFEGGVALVAAEIVEDQLAVPAQEGDDVGRHTVESTDLDRGARDSKEATCLVRSGEGGGDGGSLHSVSHPPESAAGPSLGRFVTAGVVGSVGVSTPPSPPTPLPFWPASDMFSPEPPKLLVTLVTLVTALNSSGVLVSPIESCVW